MKHKRAVIQSFQTPTSLDKIFTNMLLWCWELPKIFQKFSQGSWKSRLFGCSPRFNKKYISKLRPENKTKSFRISKNMWQKKGINKFLKHCANYLLSKINQSEGQWLVELLTTHSAPQCLSSYQKKQSNQILQDRTRHLEPYTKRNNLIRYCKLNQAFGTRSEKYVDLSGVHSFSY